MICVDAAGSSDATWIRFPVVARACDLRRAAMLEASPSNCARAVMLFVILIRENPGTRSQNREQPWKPPNRAGPLPGKSCLSPDPRVIPEYRHPADRT